MVDKDNISHPDDQGNLPHEYTVIYALEPLDARDIPTGQNSNPPPNIIHVPSEARRFMGCRYERIAGLVAVGLILIIITVGIISYKSNKNEVAERISNPPRGVCVTKECVRAAERISALHDDSISPCQDFYGFTCGKILQKQNELNSSKPVLSTLHEMGAAIPQLIRELLEEEPNDDGMEPEAVKKARYLYDNCMSNQSTASEWPSFIENHLNEKDELQLESLLAQLFAHAVSNIFSLGVIKDINDTSKHILMFDKANPSRSRLDVSAAHKFIKENLQMFAHLKNSGGWSDSMDSSEEKELDEEEEEESLALSQEGVNMMVFLRGHQRLVSTTCVTTKDMLKMPLKTTLGRMQSFLMPGIKWTFLVQQLLNILGLQHTVSSQTVVYLGCPEYFRGLLSLIRFTGRRAVIDYLTLRFMLTFAWLDEDIRQTGNPKEFENYIPHLAAESTEGNEPKKLERWEFCARNVNAGLGLAVAHLYGKNQPKELSEDVIREMFSYLKMAFREKIREQTWLSPTGSYGFRQELLSKLDYMKIKIGYPDYIMNGSALDEDYSGLNLNQSSFLLNAMEVRKFKVAKIFMKIYRKFDNDKEWYSPPLIANAFYVPSANEIVIPSGVLRSPMFDINNPTYLNFANLGSILAHEMVHGFDISALRYDKYGNINNAWWPDKVAVEFLMKAVCFVKQYQKFEMPLINKNVDGFRTWSENICDNAALPITIRAYQLWDGDGKKNEPVLPDLDFSLRRVFLVSFGQIWCEVLKKEDYEVYAGNEHSPGEFRVVGVAQNSKDFHAEFSCPYGSPMRPYDKCSLWS